MSSLSSILNIETTFGALQTGTFVSIILYGFATNQTYRYFRSYPADGWSLKATPYSSLNYEIASLWVFDTLHTIFCIHVCHHYLVKNYANPLALLYSIWSLPGTVGVGAVITMIANAYYVRRIYIIGNKNKILTAITRSLNVSSGFPQIYLADDMGTFIQCRNGYCVSRVTNVFATKGKDRTDSVIDKLMTYTMSTGLITSPRFTIYFKYNGDRLSNLCCRPSDAIHLYGGSLRPEEMVNSRKSLIRDQDRPVRQMVGIETSQFNKNHLGSTLVPESGFTVLKGWAPNPSLQISHSSQPVITEVQVLQTSSSVDFPKGTYDDAIPLPKHHVSVALVEQVDVVRGNVTRHRGRRLNRVVEVEDDLIRQEDHPFAQS
ncbi:hypothetical protein BDQ12DRAFT_671761 [Crucibulum laeve]|uniref:Uncharacterized protein n=1 Tax=Crucibulum laeve TaxID=68775 RepID=A0A5C3LFP2_9AGAR|nr:hypothetical protein BDQ12DRAFT_671761 [Crucibulum laeve]